MRYFDMTVLGKFSVVMADPPWDIHMEVHTLFHYSTTVLLFIHSHETKGHHHPSERSIYFNISYDDRKLVKAIFVISWFTANFSKLALFKCMAIGKENLSLELGTEIVSLFKFVLFPILYSYIFFMFDSPVLLFLLQHSPASWNIVDMRNPTYVLWSVFSYFLVTLWYNVRWWDA